METKISSCSKVTVGPHELLSEDIKIKKTEIVYGKKTEYEKHNNKKWPMGLEPELR